MYAIEVSLQYWPVSQSVKHYDSYNNARNQHKQE